MSLGRSSSPTLSVLIRVRDEAAALSRVLTLLAEQSLSVPWEVVIIDNASVDGSAEVGLAAGARVYDLPRHHFGYGRAINLGVELCRGEFVVLLSAHAWPQGRHWLQTMLEALETDPNLAGAYCRQVAPRRLPRQETARYRRFGSERQVVVPEDLARCVESAADPYEVCRFSNAACILRRDVCSKLPFRDLLYAEDRAFALDALLDGWGIAYEAHAVASYERRWTARSLYHVARRAQISKHWIRDIATTGLGRSMRRSALISRLLRLLLKPIATVATVLAAPVVDSGCSGRACRYAFASWGTTLGLLVGEVVWRRYPETAGCDATAHAAARRHLVLLPPTAGRLIEREEVAT